MKKLLLSIVGIFVAGASFAQTYTYVDVNQISFVSQANLQNCNDSSAYLGDTIITRGVVIMDGNLSEVASGSVTGGSRPFIHIADTANGGAQGPFSSINLMGVDAGSSNPNSNVENALAGDIIECTCIVSEFAGGIQLQPLSSTAVSLVGVATPPAPVVVPVGDLQNNQRINQLTTGEQWEGAYIEIQNVTVTGVSTFSGGNRTEITVEDASGNRILVADRYLGMRMSGVATVNPNSPVATGSFVPPAVGTVYNFIRGVIVQDENGPCYPGASGFAGGYEINPIDSNDFDQAASPAIISAVARTPLVPNATQSVTVSADIVDFDGTVTSATLFYTADQTAPANLFQSVAMTNPSGSMYTATIPATPLDSVVRYFIVAIDDSSNVSSSPSSSPSGPLNTYFYTVRPNGATIMDIQFNPSSSDASPLENDTVTVTGIVTATYQTGDLGYLYMQDANATENAGIFVNGGPASVFGLNRGDEITVQGVVEEAFGFTRLNAITVTATSNTGTITPVVIDPSDASLFGAGGAQNIEKYESMLLRYENPVVTGQVNVTDFNLGFGEFEVGSGASATVGARILTARQTLGQAQGSLDVSYTSDTAQYGSSLNVTPVQLTNNYAFDAIEGILFYAFGNFKLTPRNNADFVNVTVGIKSLVSNEVETAIYPNPAQNQVNIKLDEAYAFDNLNVQVVDLTGRVVLETQVNTAMSTLNVEELKKGMYLVRISNGNDTVHASKLILK